MAANQVTIVWTTTTVENYRLTVNVDEIPADWAEDTEAYDAFQNFVVAREVAANLRDSWVESRDIEVVKD